MRKAIAFFSLFFTFGFYAFATQGKTDSLYNIIKAGKPDTNEVNALNTLSEWLKNKSNYDSSLACAVQAEQIAEKTGFKKGLAEALRNKAIVYWSKGNFAPALGYANKALALNREISNKTGIASDLCSIGTIYEDEGNYPQALDYDLKSLTVSQQTGDKQSIATNLSNIAIIYCDQENYTQALGYSQKALNIYRQKNESDSTDIARIYGNIGSIYLDTGQYSKAMEYYSKALELYRQIKDNDGIAINLGNIAITYEDEKNYVQALKYNFDALELYKQIGDKDGIAYTFIDIGSDYTHEKDYTNAKKYLDSAVTLSMSMRHKADIQYAYSYLANLDSASGNYKKAYGDYKIYITYRDSLNNEENTKKLVSEQMTYEFDKKEATQKAVQDKKDALAAADKHRQQLITASVSIGLLLVLVFSGMLFNRFKITQKQKKIIEKQKVLVEEKNKEVLDSITYAKRLQDAILPPLSIVRKYFPESFVLYKPKDIVAGDFYWMEREGDTILIAACDCTGHGVPGAMVSVVCSNALNRAANEFKIRETGKLLDKVRELVLETFSQRDALGEKSEGEVKDGMDCSVCAINTKTKEVEWSGAYNPLWYTTASPNPSEGGAYELVEITADKQPIGKTDNPKPFTTHTITLNPPSEGREAGTLYLFTDGYADQFGGPKGKKFKYKQLQELLAANANKPMEEQGKILNETIEAWRGELEQVDDILVIGIRV